MTLADIARLRLYNQHLTRPDFKSAQEVVAWFGAVQAQDYPGAKWALAQRMRHATDAIIERAFNDGKILRTHVMRPTWHFVAPADIRWMLELTAPRVKPILRVYDRRLGIDEQLLKKSHAIITKALTGKKYLTRTELADKLESNKIPVRGQKLGHIVAHAELDAVICSGPRKGKQFTYALLKERAPQAKSLSRDEALARLTKRYFTSHGPATIKDFVWWSGLTTVDARRGLDAIKSEFAHDTIEGNIYWYAKSLPKTKPVTAAIYLLPNYDEYTIAYKIRGAYFDPKDVTIIGTPGNAAYAHAIVGKGRIIGMWKRFVKKDSILIDANFFKKPTKQESKELQTALKRYEHFLGIPVSLA